MLLIQECNENFRVRCVCGKNRFLVLCDFGPNTNRSPQLLGSYVEFTKGERGIFTRANPDNIKNPVALVLSGADGKFLRKIEEADTADKA